MLQLEIKNTVSLNLRLESLDENPYALVAAGRLISHLFSRVVQRPRPAIHLSTGPAEQHPWNLPPDLETKVEDAIATIRGSQTLCKVRQPGNVSHVLALVRLR